MTLQFDFVSVMVLKVFIAACALALVGKSASEITRALELAIVPITGCSKCFHYMALYVLDSLVVPGFRRIEEFAKV